MKKEVTELIIKDTIFLVLLILFFVFGIGPGYVSSGSMEPAIRTGDLVLCNKLVYKIREPKRGDIVTFSVDGKKEKYCKRIIGLPGETIRFLDGKVYIDDVVLDEASYIGAEVRTDCDESFMVPKDSYFVMGDHREDSFDSRFWQEPYVKREQIHARVILVLPTHGLLRPFISSKEKCMQKAYLDL